MVTSSAVVGSSAMSRRGLHAMAIAIMTRWFMPPESWCGIVGQPARGRGDADLLQQLHRARARRLAVEREMQAQRLLELEADGEARIEAGGRLLEDHRDVAAEHLAPGAVGQREQVLPAEREPLRPHASRERDEAHQRQHGHALARAGLADDAEHLALAKRQAHAVDRAQGAALRREVDVEVLDLEQRHAGGR